MRRVVKKKKCASSSDGFTVGSQVNYLCVYECKKEGSDSFKNLKARNASKLHAIIYWISDVWHTF